LLSSRTLGSSALGASIAAGFFDSFVLVAFTGYVYSYGWPALSLFIGTAAGLLLFSLFAPRLRKEAGDHGYFGMSDYFEKKYGHGSAVVVSIINVVFYIALLLIQIIFGSTVLAQITGFSYETCILLIAGTLLIYVGTGGFRAVVMTDIFQWSLIGVLLVIVAILLFGGNVKPVITHTDWSKAVDEWVL
jgi:SSS family solute:Na+ symporter